MLQVCEKRKIYGFGYGADMSRFAPKAHLTASLDLWGPYYIERAKAVLDGSWKSDDVWWGFKEGHLAMAPYNKAVPDNVRAAADKIIAGRKAGTYDVFTGPIWIRAARSASPRASAWRTRTFWSWTGTSRACRAEEPSEGASLPSPGNSAGHPLSEGISTSFQERVRGEGHAANSCTLASGHTALAISARC